MRRSSRSVSVSLPFPHGSALASYRAAERRRVRRSSAVRHGLLIILGLVIGGLIGLTLPLPERSPAARAAVQVSGYAVSLAPLDSMIPWADCVALWEAGKAIDDRCAY